MIRPPLDITPLFSKFAPVFRSFGNGVLQNVRDKTREFMDDLLHGVDTTSEEIMDGKSVSQIVNFLDGSGFTTTVTTFPDGNIGFSFTFMADTPEAMSAMLDIAAAGFTEMDSKSLASGLSH